MEVHKKSDFESAYPKRRTLEISNKTQNSKLSFARRWIEKFLSDDFNLLGS
jgi:hypothetical protein